MANYLKPKRGRRSTAEEQNFILKRGEVFFECPETGQGTGTGRIKLAMVPLHIHLFLTS